MLKTRFVYGDNDALLEISSAHNFGACTNVSCFVCLRFYVPLENVEFKWRRDHYQWSVANFELCTALIAIEQWSLTKFFSWPNVLWHRASVYNNYLREPVKLTLVVQRVAACHNLSVATDIRTPNLPLARRMLLQTAQLRRSKRLLISYIYLFDRIPCYSWW